MEKVVRLTFPGLLRQFSNFLTGSIKVAALRLVSTAPCSLCIFELPVCVAVFTLLLSLPFLTFLLSFHLPHSSPPPSFLSLSLSLSPALGHGTRCSLLQTL